jgi:eukaryotic-like serine/threonine-protein kinase
MTSTFEHRDGDTDTLLNDLGPGKFLGRYEITRLIGRGGMGSVYEAVHRDLGKRVAIKTLLPSLAASPEARGRFLREGQAASRIRHPHVVDVTDVVAEGPTSYLVMEYLEGEDLSSLVERQGALALEETADVLLPVIAAIAAAHELGVIHRDLKPENIFLARTALGGLCPKVVDFGISKVIGDPTAIALTATSAVFGTMFYLPPEQLGGSREADERGDQYALATILYECVTGHRAFEGTSIYGVLKSVAEGVYPPARSWRPDLPPRLEWAIDRAMRLNPAARFSSVRALGAALLPYTSAAVRAVWTPVFGDAAGEVGGERGPGVGEASRDEVEERRDEVEAPVRVRTGTMLLREAGSVRLGTSTYPPGGDVAHEDLRPPRSRAPRVVAIGVALAVATVAVVSGVRRTGEVAPVEPVEVTQSGAAGAAPVVAAPVPARAVPVAPVPVAPVPARQESPVSRPTTPIAARPAASRASAVRRRRPRTPRDDRAPPTNAIDPLPELRTNVPIPD